MKTNNCSSLFHNSAQIFFLANLSLPLNTFMMEQNIFKIILRLSIIQNHEVCAYKVHAGIVISWCSETYMCTPAVYRCSD